MAKIKWLGHAAFQITTAQGQHIYIDPWLEGNPSCPVAKEDLEPADLVLVTHDHHDHLGDAAALLEEGGAVAAGQPELIGQLEEAGVPTENPVGMNIGSAEAAGGGDHDPGLSFRRPGYTRRLYFNPAGGRYLPCR